MILKSKKKYKLSSKLQTKEEYEEIKKANKKALDEIFARPNWMEELGKKYYGEGWLVTLDGNHPARMERAKERNTETFKRSKGEDVPYKIANTHKPIYKLDSDGNVLAKYKSADEWCEINNEPIRKAQSLVKAARGLALTAFGDIWVFEEDYNKLNKK